MGALCTVWTARIAFVFYAAALAAWLTGRPRLARGAWTSGFLVYAAHVAAAFHFYHHWSHDAAYDDTARQTAELMGEPYGGGLYANYLFTALWALDVAWICLSPDSYRRRPRWISRSVHAFMAFLFFNAAVVFVSGWFRWLGLAITAALVLLWLRSRSKPSALELREHGPRERR
jgi:hypothetical protein